MNLKAKRIFRCLVILTITSSIMSIVLYFLERNSLPIEVKEYLLKQDAQMPSRDHVLLLGVSILGVLLFVTSFIGLYVFWPPARFIYTIFILIGLFIPLYCGLAIEPRGVAFWGAASEILDGIVLGMIFTSPVNELFTKSKSR